MFKHKLAYGLFALIGCIALGYWSMGGFEASDTQNTIYPEWATHEEDPEAGGIRINAAKYAEIGELIKLKVTGGVDSTFSWQQLDGGADFAVFMDGREAVFSARKNGTYRFILAVSTENKASVLIHTIKVGVPPDTILEWVQIKCNKIHPDKEKVAKLAASFKLIAERINAGLLKDAIVIAKTTAESNKLVIAGDEKLIALMAELQTLLKTKADNGELVTPADHAKIWIELSTALNDWASYSSFQTVIE